MTWRDLTRDYLKVHKHESKSNPDKPLINFRNFFASFPSFFARISKFKHFHGDWAYVEPNFLGEKIFFFKMFTWVLLDGFQNVFSKFGFYRTLSIRGNDFIVHWAYTERIFRVCSDSGKMLTVFTCTAMLSILGNDFFSIILNQNFITMN